MLIGLVGEDKSPEPLDMTVESCWRLERVWMALGSEANVFAGEEGLMMVSFDSSDERSIVSILVMAVSRRLRG